ncbi:MAG: hypothetical protein HYV37_02450 [Candidatus Levyibacteriota bacterium]|nr:MAG: hypothetical protein HYV37_02450 [Candidatus Levybacteria bacterium]
MLERLAQLGRALQAAGNLDIRVNRRGFLKGGLSVVGVFTLSGCEPAPSTSAPSQATIEIGQPEIELRDITSSFNHENLSDPEPRSKVVELTASITEKLQLNSLTKEQMVASIVWVEDPLPRAREKAQRKKTSIESELARMRTWSAETDNGKVYVYIHASTLQKSYWELQPQLHWNPLKELVHALDHEWKHLEVRERTDARMDTLLDPENAFSGKVITGFRMNGTNASEFPKSVYAQLDEGITDYLATQSVLSYFGAVVNSADVATMVDYFPIIFKEAGILPQTIQQLHQESKFYEFLILLAKIKGVEGSIITERQQVLAGLAVVNALVNNDKPTIEKYIQAIRENKAHH